MNSPEHPADDSDDHHVQTQTNSVCVLSVIDSELQFIHLQAVHEIKLCYKHE